MIDCFLTPAYVFMLVRTQQCLSANVRIICAKIYQIENHQLVCHAKRPDLCDHNGEVSNYISYCRKLVSRELLT